MATYLAKYEVEGVIEGTSNYTFEAKDDNEALQIARRHMISEADRIAWGVGKYSLVQLFEVKVVVKDALPLEYSPKFRPYDPTRAEDEPEKTENSWERFLEYPSVHTSVVREIYEEGLRSYNLGELRVRRLSNKVLHELAERIKKLKN